MTPIDFDCSWCKAKAGDACISAGFTPQRPSGALLVGFHKARRDVWNYVMLAPLRANALRNERMRNWRGNLEVSHGHEEDEEDRRP